MRASGPMLTAEQAARIRCIRTPRLVLRCWDESDAPAALEAITESLEHLRVFMPWAHEEPTTVEAKVELFRAFRMKFEQGVDFIYGILDRDTGQVLGGTGLHGRVGAAALEIGYWIHADHLRRGYATECSAALTRLGFEHLDLTLMEIHCDPTNMGSAGVPRKLGYRLAAVIPNWVARADGTPRDSMIWRMTAEAFPASPAAEVPIELPDA